MYLSLDWQLILWFQVGKITEKGNNIQKRYRETCLEDVAYFEDKQKIFWFIDSTIHDDSFRFSDELHDDVGKYRMDLRVP